MFLSHVLKANALFSFVCGGLCLTLSSTIAEVMGDVPPMLVLVLGFGLLVFAADVFWISQKLPAGRGRAQFIFWADTAWVILTPIAIAIFYAHLSFIGVLVFIDVAVFVAIFAGLEWWGLKKLESNSSSLVG